LKELKLENIRVAIIGYGFLGKWHAEKAFGLTDASLVAIVDSFEQSQINAREKFPDVKVCSNVEEIINEIDAAIVVTPTSTHFNLVKYLIENNKHVFCEKPLTSKLEDSITIKKLLSSRELILQVGHSERFHEIWERKELYSPFLEAPCSLKISRYAPFKGRATDVDVVQDLMIHDLDLVKMLLKENPIEISSTGFKSLTEKWDHVEALLKFENGSRSSVIVGRNSVEEVRTVEITNEKGTILIDLLHFQVNWSAQKNNEHEVKTEKYNKRDHLLLEQQEFYQAIINKSLPRVDCNAGVEAVALVDQVLKSLELGK
jgi:predicted dehydrogenase